MQIVEELIWKQANRFADKIAIRNDKESITYHELMCRILSAKFFFEHLPNYTKGGTIIISATKQFEFVYAYFGAHLANLIVVPLDSECNAERFHFITKTVKPFFIIGFNNFSHQYNSISFIDININIITEFPANILFPQLSAISDILFTTGTTGVPKGVPLSYLNETAAVRNINVCIGNTTSDVELLALPISHSFGLGRLRCCLANGQTLILLGSFVNTKKLFRLIEEYHVNGFSMVPASWKFLQSITGDNLSKYSSQLKYIEMGSAFLSIDEKIHLADLFPKTRLMMHYGLTEASRSAYLNFHADVNHLQSVGKPTPYTDIRIFNEKGELVPIGMDGEICIRGEHVTTGYLGENNSCFYGNKYFRTGDFGYMDKDGYIYLKARIKEIINVGGKKVSPIEIEEKILHIAGVKDCACIAAPDPKGILGEVVKAYIVKDNYSSLSFQDISTELTGKIENYKLPVIYKWIDEIPRTPNGKIQRNLLNNDSNY
jgi:long-chain acyl-CoA synthetase